jgi:hypothetical protein
VVQITYFSRASSLDLILELLLGGIYLSVILVITILVRAKSQDRFTKIYFIPALMFKMLGLLGFAAVYYFVYEYGDTFVYYESATIMGKILTEDLYYGTELFLGFNDYVRAKDFLYNHFLVNYYRGQDTFLVIKIAAILSIVGLGKFLSTSIIFSVLTFISQWYLFKALILKYEKQVTSLAIGILFIPSVAFWGSGIMKDSIILGAVCVLIANLFRWIELGKRPTILQVLVMVVSVYFIYTIKYYIILAVFPMLGFWLYFKFNRSIRNKVIRVVIAPVGILLVSGIIAISFIQFSEIDQRLQLDRMLAQADTYQRNHYSETGGEGTGSGYTLGVYDASLFGLATKTIPAINVTLFRPYLWEIKSPAMAIAALESFVMTLLFFRMLWFWRKRNIYQTITSDTFLAASLIFVLFLSFIVGFTAFNFGALVRYKIPCMPFFYLLLTLPVNRSYVKSQVQLPGRIRNVRPQMV